MKRILLFIFLFSLIADAYVVSKIGSGDPVKWDSSSLPLAVYYDGTLNCDTSDDPKEIVDSAISEWDGEGKLMFSTDILRASSVSSIGMGTYDLGSAVLGITEFSYRENDGAIISAKVMLNPTKEDLFTCDKTDALKYYIGDVITHELGHVLGLGHSQTHAATMMWEHFMGQREIDEDDEMGVHEVYSGNMTGFTGKVVGKEVDTEILGVYVQAIRMKDGKVVGGSLTNEDGVFSIPNLDSKEAYTLYITPHKIKSTLPTYYKNAATKFCTGRTAYKSSFYKSCSLDEKGRPKVVYTDSAGMKDLGNITINCARDVASDLIDDYIGNTSFTVSLSQALPNVAYTGLFTESDIAAAFGKDFTFSIDTGDLLDDDVIHVSVTSQQLYSYFKITPAFNFSLFDSLDRGLFDINDGNVSFRVGDYDGISKNIQIRGIDADANDFFPASDLVNNEYYYQISFTVYRDGKLLKSSDSYYEDNSECVDAPEAYEVKAIYSPASVKQSLVLDQLEVEQKNESLASCATLSRGGPGGGSGGSLGVVVSFVIGFTLISLIRAQKAAFARLTD